MNTFLTCIRRHPWAIPSLLLSVVLLTYGNSFPGAFILDDRLIVAQNPLIQQFDLVAIFRSDYWHGVNNSGLYRPLTVLSLALNRWLFGPAPLAYHLVNVLLHAAVTVLLWRMLLAWAVPVMAALLAALLFAVHPLHTEVVNEVVGRSELLAALFLLAACTVARNQKRYAPLRVGLCFLLALLSKEHAIALLVLLPLWDYFAAATPGVWRRRWPVYLSLFATAFVWLIWREFAVISAGPQLVPSVAAAPLAHVDSVTRVLSALLLQGVYLLKLLLPHGLQAVYSPADLPTFIPTILSPMAVLVVAATAGILAVMAWGLKRRSLVALFGLFYLVAFLPTANLLLPIGVSFAERLAYFPSVWFCAALGLVAARIIESRPVHSWAWLALAGYLLLLGGQTVWRNRDFSSEERLWRAEVADNPDDYVGWLNLAESQVAVGRLTEAEQSYREMLAIAPDDPTGLRSWLVFLLMRQDYPQAQALASRLFAEAQRRGDAIALAFDGRSLAEIHLGLGDCATALGYLEGPAMPIRSQPQSIEIRLATWSCLGRDEEVTRELESLDDAVVTERMLYQQGVSLMRLGRFTEARTRLEGAVTRRTNWAEGWNLLGVVCVELKDWSGAITAFARAVTLAPGETSYRDNLQRAQQEGGTSGN